MMMTWPNHAMPGTQPAHSGLQFTCPLGRGAAYVLKPTLLLLCLSGLFLRADANDAAVAALRLSYQEFDQTPHSGWRVLAEDAKRMIEAATLIEAYLASHSELDRFQRSNLHWHAAQALALAGDSAAALKHIPSARLDPEPSDSPLCWNDYVAATEAFLQHDRAKLIAAKERIAKNKPADPNLAIVASLLVHFDEPYSKAYKRE